MAMRRWWTFNDRMGLPAGLDVDFMVQMGPRISREQGYVRWRRVNAVFEIENRANGADNAGVTIQAEPLAKVVDAFDAGAMRAKNLRCLDTPSTCRRSSREFRLWR